jgi:hypothetical protein
MCTYRLGASEIIVDAVESQIYTYQTTDKFAKFRYGDKIKTKSGGAFRWGNINIVIKLRGRMYRDIQYMG